MVERMITHFDRNRLDLDRCDAFRRTLAAINRAHLAGRITDVRYHELIAILQNDFEKRQRPARVIDFISWCEKLIVEIGGGI